MKISQLENYIMIVDSGSINKAAETHYLSQPNLSRSVQSLEKELGKELLERSNHGVSMTPTGKLLYYYGKSILNELHVIEQLKYVDEGQMYAKLSISAYGIFLKDDIILRCYESLLSAQTEIQIQETTAEEVLEHVHTLKSELGVLVLNSLQYPTFKKMAELRNMEILPYGEGALYIHINEQFVQEGQKEIKFSDLLDATYIHLPNDFFANMNHSLSFDGLQLTNFPKQLIMSNYHAMLHFAKHTHSFLIGHPWQIEELKHSHMKSLLLKNSPIHCHFVVIKRKNDLLSESGKVFLRLLEETYQPASLCEKSITSQIV